MNLVNALWFAEILCSIILASKLVHTLLTLSMSTDALAVLLRTWFGPAFNEISNIAFLGLANIFLIGWIVLLDPRGEETLTTMTPAYQPDVESRLVDQLETLNRLLGSVPRLQSAPHM